MSTLNILSSGSSPRLRGTGFILSMGCPSLRFIPAPAGNSQASGPFFFAIPVHPRACGEQFGMSVDSKGRPGSSPRLRGTVIHVCSSTGFLRFIPAPAGNRCTYKPFSKHFPVHPRACGEQQETTGGSLSEFGSSPRLRGTDCAAWEDAGLMRFIPAPAGNSAETMPSIVPRSVHPRACGEQLLAAGG